MAENNVYENIVNHFRNKGLSDDEIALNILKDNIQMSLLDFALENLSDEEALTYYESLQEDIEVSNEEKSFYNPINKTTIHYKEIPKELYETLNKKVMEYWLTVEIENRPKFTKDEIGFFIYKEPDGRYTAINNLTSRPFIVTFEEKETALKYLSGESSDKLKDEECRYEVAIYETKEDYEQGEPFQENVYSSLEEAENSLNYLMKQNNYYSGFVLDQKTGIEECAYYSDEQQEEPEEEEM